MSRYTHNRFNDARVNANCSKEHLAALRRTLEEEGADPTHIAEVDDLVTDAEVLARRIDRLHHDFAHDEIAAADDRIGPTS